MSKAMIFIDGTWLYQNMSRLLDYTEDRNYQIDFHKLPEAIVNELKEQLPGQDFDIIRGYMFGAYPVKVDPQDEVLSLRQRDFYVRLREEFFYHVETYPVNFKGRRIRRIDRDPTDPFHPREAQATLSLATTAMHNCYMHAFDVAIFLIGDRDYKPLIRSVRRFGKRTAIVSIRNACTPEFATPQDRTKVADFDTVWMDELVSQIQLVRKPHMLECQGPSHAGDPMVWTTYYPRPGQRFYCDDCRVSFDEQREQQLAEIDEERERAIEEGELFFGSIKTVKVDKGFGFVTSDQGLDYFFHYSDLSDGTEFTEELISAPVSFYIVREPEDEKAGAATMIRLEDS
jgi:cold shock CspA family protein